MLIPARRDLSQQHPWLSLLPGIPLTHPLQLVQKNLIGSDNEMSLGSLLYIFQHPARKEKERKQVAPT